MGVMEDKVGGFCLSWLFYASNEPKSVLARDLGDCRDNLRNSRSVFLIVGLTDPLYGACVDLVSRLLDSGQ